MPALTVSCVALLTLTVMVVTAYKRVNEAESREDLHGNAGTHSTTPPGTEGPKLNNMEKVTYLFICRVALR